MNNKISTLKGHLNELKKRLIYIVLFFIIASSCSYMYAEVIYDFLVEPLSKATTTSRKLIFTGLTEGFFVYVKLALFTGFLISFPFTAFQTYKFLAPGLYQNEKKILIPFLMAAPFLFMLGALLVYYYIMPLAWKFFVSFESSSVGAIPIVLEPRISEYLNLVLSLIIGFGIAFQLPLVLILLVRFGIISASALVDARRHAIVLIFIAAAILTPPDIITQVALAIPLMLLYEISVLICKKIEHKVVLRDDRY